MLLHEACSQTTDVLTFSVVLMNCKAMVNHQGEVSAILCELCACVRVSEKNCMYKAGSRHMIDALCVRVCVCCYQLCCDCLLMCV